MYYVSFRKKGCSRNDYEKIWESILLWKNMIMGDDQKYHPYEFCGVEYFRAVDSDIIALFNQCRNICIKTEDNDSLCSRLLTEFFSRVYKKSLWKSFAEFNIFFSFLSDDEKRKLQFLISSNDVSDSFNNQYGYFKDEWESKFNEFGLKNVIWVSADSKLKALDPDKTCIVFKDTTINYRTVSLSQDIQIELE